MHNIRALPNTRTCRHVKRSHPLRWMLWLALLAAPSWIFYEKFADEPSLVNKPHPLEPQLHSDPLTFMFGREQ